jgi:uncharacterized membrane protein
LKVPPIPIDGSFAWRASTVYSSPSKISLLIFIDVHRRIVVDCYALTFSFCSVISLSFIYSTTTTIDQMRSVVIASSFYYSTLLVLLLQWQQEQVVSLSLQNTTPKIFHAKPGAPRPSSASASVLFSSSSSIPSLFGLQQQQQPTKKRGSVFFTSFMLSSSQAETPQELFLRQVEKKEAELLKRKEEAQARLVQYEASIKELRDKKASYLVASPDEPPPFTETALRSAVKAFCWRLIAGSITFISTLKFSGSLAVALKVVGADFFSKSFTMFLGERIMNKSQAGRKSGSDDMSRSFAKALIWRLFAIANTLCMAVFVAKDLSMASKIASTDAVVKTLLMVIYERIWARIQWGKEYMMEWSI